MPPESITSNTICQNPIRKGQETTVTRQPDGTYACVCSLRIICTHENQAISAASTGLDKPLPRSPKPIEI